ncbi:MAG: hypothetical protein SW833_06180 [Cyanobacteriota bacterium]|nr:hypothetical protein [Cyanobacteriota bacterium]
MINHVSIGARNPEFVANILAEIWKGYTLPFPPIPGAFIAFADDNCGTCIEVVPMTNELVPGVGEPDDTLDASKLVALPFEVQNQKNPNASNHSATHVSIVSPLSEEEVTAIAQREGWRVLTCNRGPAFPVIEVWLENRCLLEVMTSEMMAHYVEFMQPENWAKALNVPLR